MILTGIYKLIHFIMALLCLAHGPLSRKVISKVVTYHIITLNDMCAEGTKNSYLELMSHMVCACCSCNGFTRKYATGYSNLSPNASIVFKIPTSFKVHHDVHLEYMRCNTRSARALILQRSKTPEWHSHLKCG